MKIDEIQQVARVTLMIHHGLTEKAMDLLTKLGLNSVIVENARCVRQNVYARRWGFSRLQVELIDTPTDILRFVVSKECSDCVLCKLIKELELKTPGHGAVYSQDIVQGSVQEIQKLEIDQGKPEQLLNDLTLITGIQSKSGSSENLSRTALKLGAGVPVVGLGLGAGFRDQLGLLRITISPEKELVYLMVPSHDAKGLQNLLIDEGHLDRPDGGFLYQTPIRAGMVDPLLRIGHQEHAASIEQIIAAIDDLKKNTAWRKRIFGVEDSSKNTFKKGITHNELSFICHSDYGDELMQAAIEAGAQGATIKKVRMLNLQGDEAGHSIPCEQGIICLEASKSEAVMNAILAKAKEIDDKNTVIQSIEAGSIFTHKRS
ncbi:MAG: hypothetical protein PHF08_09660 [Candidatus Riflebacteria bacterium]|nr:hypothetical protein [Candidatus Riflebacteria bacterium]